MIRMMKLKFFIFLLFFSAFSLQTYSQIKIGPQTDNKDKNSQEKALHKYPLIYKGEYLFDLYDKSEQDVLKRVRHITDKFDILVETIKNRTDIVFKTKKLKKKDCIYFNKHKIIEVTQKDLEGYESKSVDILKLWQDKLNKKFPIIISNLKESTVEYNLVRSGIISFIALILTFIIIFLRRLVIRKAKLQDNDKGIDENKKDSPEFKVEQVDEGIIDDSQPENIDEKTYKSIHQIEHKNHFINFFAENLWIFSLTIFSIWFVASFFILYQWIFIRQTIVSFAHIIGMPFLKIIILIVALTISIVIMNFIKRRFINFLISSRVNVILHTSRAKQRLKTLNGVIRTLIIFFHIIVGFFIAISILELDLVPILTGAGIVGIAIGFGAQSIFKDWFTGLLIFIEDQYGIGDVVTINNNGGLVENMTLRITQLRSADGSLITIPNGEIKIVENLTSEWSRVNLNIPVSYNTDLEKAQQVIIDVADRLFEEWNEEIIEKPELLGLDAFGSSEVVFKVWIKTVPLKQWKVKREFLLRLKKAFDSNNIEIPFPQRTIWMKTKDDLDKKKHEEPTKEEEKGD